MNKLYWIVCEENERTLYEGRFLGRTRGSALKHLKEQLGRSNLTGLVFAITEIPITLIREIIAECLASQSVHPPPSIPIQTGSDLNQQASETEPQIETAARASYDWQAIKICYMEGRSPKDVAALMNVPINTLKTRITREGWAKQRRQA